MVFHLVIPVEARLLSSETSDNIVGVSLGFFALCGRVFSVRVLVITSDMSGGEQCTNTHFCMQLIS